MDRKRIAAAIMAVCLLVPSLPACSKGNKITVVKEEDPWFESTRFKLKTEQLSTEMLDSSVVGSSKDKVFHLYSLTNLADYENYRRTLLSTYDDKGNLVSTVNVKDPENYAIKSAYSIKPADDGKTAEAVMSVFAQGGFSTAVVNLDLTTGETTEPRFLTNKPGEPLEIHGDGQNTYGVSDIQIAGEYYIPVILVSERAGGMSVHAFSFKGSEFKNELDFSGIPSVYTVESFSYDQKNNSLFAVGYTAIDGVVIIEFDPDTGKRKSYKKYDAGNKDQVNVTEFKTASSGELYKIDTLGNITTFNMQSAIEEPVIDSDWYAPYFSDMTALNVQLVKCSSDMAVIYSRKDKEYSMFFTGFDETVTILKRSEKNPHAGKKIIELAAPTGKGMKEYLSNAVYEFNRTDDEYIIRIWNKYKTGIKAGRSIAQLNAEDELEYTMIQELKGSDAPDIAIGVQKNGAMRDDIFEDLSGYLEASVLEKQYKNIIDASKINGKQYFLPVTIEIEGLVTDTSLVKNGASGITFEEYDKMIKTSLNGFSPYDYPLSTYNNKISFVLSCIDIKSAIDGDKIDFTSEQFKAVASYSNEHFAVEKQPVTGDYVFDEEAKKERTGCRYDRLDSFIKFVHACKSDKESYTIIGTPSADASGPRFRAIETVSVTASSDRKDGCKKFINFLFGGAGYGDSGAEFQDIVTNKDVMAKNISVITEINNIEQDRAKDLFKNMAGSETYQKIYGYKYASEDMGKKFLESLAAIGTYYYDDPKITAFLVEEIAPYYAGDRSIDDVIKFMNDRTRKYIKEM